MKHNIIRPHIKRVDLEEIARNAPVEQERTPPPPTPPNPTPPNNELETKPRGGFIYVPSLNLSFSKERLYTNADWHNTHRLLQEEKLRMPVLIEFTGFLKYLRDSPEEEHQILYKEITKVKNPWRANWIDSYFEQREDGWYLLSNHIYKGIDDNGKIILEAGKTEKLDDCLMKDRGKYVNDTEGIDINDWLDKPTKQGFPRNNIQDGELNYLHPRDKCVAWFNAYSDWSWFDCCWGPSYRDASLGVFSCAEGAAPKI